jgi:glycerophosphoryl diester phosphodiesterase
MIEADVRRTRDGVLVMLHDDGLERTTSGRGSVADVDLAELRRLDAGGWFSPAFAGEVVPTLDELFELAELNGIALCLESKGETADEQLAVSAGIADAIVARDRLDRDVLSSFDHGALAATARRHPNLQLAPERLPERGPSTAASVVAQARAVGASIVQHHHLDLAEEVVAGAHAAGIAIWAWPTTARDDLARALRLRVDGLMGDDVETMIDLLAAN